METGVSLQYLAGLIDGEGCITIFHDRTQKGKAPVVTGRFALGMTSFPIIEKLQRQFGGYLYHKKERPGNRQPMLYWQANEQVAAHFLRDCLPYMEVKQRQAELLIELAGTRSKHNSGVNGASDDIATRRWEIMEECKRLNKRGKSDA